MRTQFFTDSVWPSLVYKKRSLVQDTASVGGILEKGFERWGGEEGQEFTRLKKDVLAATPEEKASFRKELDRMAHKIERSAKLSERDKENIDYYVDNGEFREALQLLQDRVERNVLPPEERERVLSELDTLRFSISPDASLDQAAEIFDDDEKLEASLGEIEAFKGEFEENKKKSHAFQKFLTFFGITASFGLAKGQTFLEKVINAKEKYFSREGAVEDVKNHQKKKSPVQYRLKTFEEIFEAETGEPHNSLTALKHPLVVLKERTMYKKIKKQERRITSILGLVDIAYHVINVANKTFEKLLWMGAEALPHLKGLKHVSKETLQRWRTKKLNERSVRADFDKKIGQYKNGNKNLLQKAPQLGPERLAKGMHDQVEDLQGFMRKHPEVAEEYVQKGKVPGFKLKSLSKGFGIAFSVRLLRTAIHSGGFGEFKAEVTNMGFWKQTSEMLPIWGTIASARRLNDESLGTPKWARYLEFGINAAFDAWTIGAIALSLGAATPAAVAARAGAGAANRAVFAGLGKWFAKRGAKVAAREIAEASTKKALSEGAEAGVKTVVREGVQEGAEVLGKEVVEEAAEEAVKKGMKEAAEKGAQHAAKEGGEQVSKTLVKELWRGIKWDSGLSAVSFAAEKAWSHFYPDKTVGEVAIGMGADQAKHIVRENYAFTPTQLKLLETVGQKDKVPDYLRPTA